MNPGTILLLLGDQENENLMHSTLDYMVSEHSGCQLYNPLSPSSDHHQFSFNNIDTLSREIVTRISQMITKEKML